MAPDTTASTPNYITVIEPVREITLTGSADLPYWQAALRGVELYPLEDNGRASLLISAISSRFRGLAFREFTVSIYISLQPDGGSHDGFYLLHAFNSSRLLAFAERAFFQTPYYPADVQVSTGSPPTVAVRLDGRELFRAAQTSARPAEREAIDIWEGPIYLPADSATSKVFFARLGGPAAFNQFTGDDSLEIGSSPAAPVFQSLLDSGFRGELWRTSDNASHARSRTHNRR